MPDKAIIYSTKRWYCDLKKNVPLRVETWKFQKHDKDVFFGGLDFEWDQVR